MVSISLITQRLMLMEEPRKSWVKRSVFTKIFCRGLSRKHILDGTKACLKRLDMDYVDVIYSQHITEAWGIAEKADLVGPIVEQPEYNLLSGHSEYLPLYTNFGLSLTTHY
ncbi:hypothetical protein POTOM_039210 [Populus tomentosa]|uniref:Uncharacterized protein n=1 Tax=Populus tomentosa TaxID=118781 RepID=A0A8X7YTC1_POPTO|nr:hypothetical protein POTOM_039210 [Populus tomentosa]